MSVCFSIRQSQKRQSVLLVMLIWDVKCAGNGEPHSRNSASSFVWETLISSCLKAPDGWMLSPKCHLSLPKKVLACKARSQSCTQGWEMSPRPVPELGTSRQGKCAGQELLRCAPALSRLRSANPKVLSAKSTFCNSTAKIKRALLSLAFQTPGGRRWGKSDGKWVRNAGK